MKPRADWLAWSLQLVAGLFAGSGVGFIIARGLVRLRFTDFDHMLYVVVGVSLCCGAFTSFHGNRAWMMPSVFAPSEPPQSRRARTCSIIVGTIGAGLILIPIILHVINVGWPARKSFSMEFSIFLLLIAALPGFLLVHAVRTGAGFWRFGIIHREETPLIFWLYVILNALAVVCILAAIL